MNKTTFIVGFTLFAIFFGAGNLIFPPRLGLESGTNFWSAIFGFVLTGVGLPLIGIIVSAFYEGGYKNAINRIHPWFSVVFLIAIYLSIGPFFAIPRTATTSYELVVLPFIHSPGQMSLFIFSVIYFLLSLWLALNPSKMVERIGAVLTPMLLIAILALVTKATFLLMEQESAVQISSVSNDKSAFFYGFVQGYLTMDTLASLAYSVIILAAIQAKGIRHKTELIRQTVMASIIAGVALMLIYISLAWIGNKMILDPTLLAESKQDIGTYILNTITTQAFGNLGQILLGLIVTLACLTTTVGLIVSVSEYFNEIYHKISYKTYVVIFTFIGLCIANQGLNYIITKSIPILLVLYPISMTIILLLCINLFMTIPIIAQRISIGLVSLISIASVSGMSFIEKLPLKEYSLEWLIFAVAGTIIGYILHLFKPATGK